ncbi:MerR family transcriptional regulator [Salana multivorans]
MHSGKLARLAGVTVRALRHYHQVGVLAEPARRSNGYREYDVRDLVRVLRIKRLASIGVALERMPDILDDVDDDAAKLLDELDTELAAQIDRLTRQRDLIARLRSVGAAPDLPPELAPFLAALPPGLSPELAKFDRDQSVLLAHLVDDEGLSRVMHLYERLSGPDAAPVVAAVSERFSRLGPDSTDQEIAELAESFVTLLAPVAEELAASSPTTDLSAVADIFAEHTAGALNEQQQRTLAEVQRRLS